MFKPMPVDATRKRAALRPLVAGKDVVVAAAGRSRQDRRQVGARRRLDQDAEVAAGHAVAGEVGAAPGGSP
jgi:hypothetical protein